MPKPWGRPEGLTGRMQSKPGRKDRGVGATFSDFKKSTTLSIAPKEMKLDTSKFLLRNHTVIMEALSALFDRSFRDSGNVLALCCPILTCQPSTVTERPKCG